MHGLTVIQIIEAGGLVAVGAWAVRVGKWRLAFVPLACAGLIGAVLAAGY